MSVAEARRIGEKLVIASHNAGKIREIGCSNFSAEQLRAANAAADAAGWPRFAAAQEQYSLLHRAAAAELIAECERSGVALLPWRPLLPLPSPR